jgi:sucrose 6(F)-phosphate phosphorylase
MEKQTGTIATMKNQIQLLTYPDSLGGDLPNLIHALNGPLKDLFGGIHILPPFPSTADRGFAPTTYFEIEPAFGSWADIQPLSQKYDIMLDLMVNHISRQSIYFQHFVLRGRRSVYADLFITLDKVWRDGQPDPNDVSKIFLRRPEHPFADIQIIENGEVERVWATFGKRDWSEQIDLDIHSDATRSLFTDIFAHFGRHGINLVRLDAVAFVIKKPGTSCFFVEPEIYDFLAWITEQAAQSGIQLLLEVHAEESIQQKLSEHGYWRYDFALPLLVLHTLLHRTNQPLLDHLSRSPRKQYTQLDSHDGIPVQPDINGILSIEDAQDVVAICEERGANLSRIFSPQHRTSPEFDAHQINITYFSALGGDEDAYLAARAIQFFAPGIPQVYYVGLLAGENDQDAVERTGERRAINRHDYTVEEIEEAVERPVVQRLMKLIRLRNEHPAFRGDFRVLPSGDREVHLEWQNAGDRCTLALDLDSYRAMIEFTTDRGFEEMQV